MKNQTKQLRLTVIFASLLPLSCFSSPCEEASAAKNAATNEDPNQYIEFIFQPDGRCQILSKGGELLIVKNTHSDKKIKYRFNRMFAGKRQAGLAMGILEPGAEAVKLGCTEVDGREQTWKIKTVTFVE